MQPTRHKRATARSYPTYFAFGAVALQLVFIVIPSVMGIYYSLTNWSRFSSDTDFVGSDNYRAVFGGRRRDVAGGQEHRCSSRRRRSSPRP